jgi:hypothetical protein
MIVAIIALVASLTGGAYAAVNIPDGSITNRMLANDSVWHRNIGRNSVRNFNINNGAVNNRTLAPNSVWHAQIGNGSVRANNVQPQLLSQLQSNPTVSSSFTSKAESAAPQTLTTTAATVASGDITTTTSSQGHLVLNGFVLVQRIASGPMNEVTCQYSAPNGTSSFGTVTLRPGGSAGGQTQVTLVGQTAVTPGTHTIDVSCSASTGAVFEVVGGQFTAMATG